MTDLLRDLRFALRSLGKSGGFTAVAVVTLALGIGANTALYGWVRSLLLSPLPGVSRPREIVAIETRTPAGTRIDSGWADYTDLRAQASSFTGLVAFQQRHVTLQEPRGARRLYALFVSGDYFDVLGVKAKLGRTFLPEEGRVPGGAPVAVLGYGFWRQHYRVGLRSRRPIRPRQRPGADGGRSRSPRVQGNDQRVELRALHPGGGRAAPGRRGRAAAGRSSRATERRGGSP